MNIFVLAEARVKAVLGDASEIVERFSGEELASAMAPMKARSSPPGRAAPFPLLVDDFVTTDDGTGIVHIAPAFGEDDYRVAAAAGIFDPEQPGTLLNPVSTDGTFDARVRSYGGRSYEGRFVKDAQLADELIEDLGERGLLLRAQPYEHSYPHCWRCDTPLIYYAKTSWYIAHDGAAR